MKSAYFGAIALLTLSLSASAFTINVPAHSNSGTTNEKITVTCDRPMVDQSLQMQCSLSGQTNMQTAIVNFSRDGKTLGTMHVNGVTNNTDENVQLANSFQNAPYVYSYKPEVQLRWTAEQGTILNCGNITTRTAFCKVTSG